MICLILNLSDRYNIAVNEEGKVQAIEVEDYLPILAGLYDVKENKASVKDTIIGFKELQQLNFHERIPIKNEFDKKKFDTKVDIDYTSKKKPLYIPYGLTMLFGESGSGKSVVMNHIFECAAKSTTSFKWDLDEPNLSCENFDIVHALRTLMGLIKQGNKFICIDSLSALIDFGDKLRTGAIPKEMITNSKALNQLAEFYKIYLMAIMNPTVDDDSSGERSKIRGLLKGLEGKIAGVILCKTTTIGNNIASVEMFLSIRPDRRALKDTAFIRNIRLTDETN